MKKSLAFLSSALLITMVCFAGNDKNLPKDFSPKQSKTIAFTENKGQVYDQNYKARPDVLYGAMAGNLAVHIKKTGVSYQLYRVDEWKEVEDEIRHEKRKEIEKQSIYRIDLNWLNANTNFTQSTDEALQGYNNYYLESCPNGALDVKSYTGITLHNLYNGINLHYYEKNGELKHDYIVAPHANYKQIQVEVKGADISVKKDGSLLLTTPLGKIHEGAPIVYQNGKQLKAKWVINADAEQSRIMSFEIENYNPTQELIIDPVTRLWGTYYGGSDIERGYSCAKDVFNNIFMAGLAVLNSGTIIATVGSHQTICGGGNDAFLVKFDAGGARQWSTYYGGAGTEIGQSCASDATGNVYLAGYTNSNTGTVIATAGAHQTVYGGNNDGFLVKFNASGLRQWGTYYGGSGGDYVSNCASDATGNVYLAGETESGTSTVIATAGAHQPVYSGLRDGFLVKFNSSGLRQWGTYYGGSGTDAGVSCASDATGIVYLAGYTDSNSGTVIATAGAHQPVYGGGGDDGFLVQFNASGVRLWGTYYGGAVTDLGRSCATDAMGNVYLAGYTYFTTGTAIATAGAHQPVGGGLMDGFLVKFNSSGLRQWGTFYGGSGADNVMGCASDASGNVYLAGQTASNSVTGIATAGAHQTGYGGGTYDAYLVKFNASGVRQWGTYYGGSGEDRSFSCITNDSGSVYLAGYTASNSGTNIPTISSHQSGYGGGTSDAFLAKFFDCTPPNPSNTTPATNQTICSNHSATLSAISSTNTINWFASMNSTTTIGTGTSYITATLSPGTYTYYAEASGCLLSETRTPITVLVNLTPTVSVNNGTICSGQSFTIIPSGANTYTIEGGNTVVTPNTNSSYTVVGSSSEGCLSANTATANVLVNSLPVISISAASTVICVGESIDLLASGADSYTWSPLAFSSSITVTPSITTVYSVVGQDANACENTSAFTLQVDECTGIANTLKAEARIVLYPNPNIGLLNVDLPYNAELIILNTLGQIVFSSRFDSGQHQMNLGQLANGVYVVKIQNATSSKYFNLIKE